MQSSLSHRDRTFAEPSSSTARGSYERPMPQATRRSAYKDTYSLPKSPPPYAAKEYLGTGRSLWNDDMPASKQVKTFPADPWATDGSGQISWGAGEAHDIQASWSGAPRMNPSDAQSSQSAWNGRRSQLCESATHS